VKVNTYIHPVGTPVHYVSTIGETPSWMAQYGTVTETWMTQDEPGEEPYRVYRVVLQNGGSTVWDHTATHYDFAWRDRPEFRTEDPQGHEVWCTDFSAHVLTDLRDLV
jgi:hypothetical protein